MRLENPNKHQDPLEHFRPYPPHIIHSQPTTTHPQWLQRQRILMPHSPHPPSPSTNHLPAPQQASHPRSATSNHTQAKRVLGHVPRGEQLDGAGERGPVGGDDLYELLQGLRLGV